MAGIVGGSDASLAYQKKRADEVADHVVEEAVAADDVDELFGVALKARLVNGADVGGVAESGGGVRMLARLRFARYAAGAGSARRRARSGSTAANEVKSCSPATRAAACCMAVSFKRIGVVGDVAGEKGRNDIAAPDAVVIALGAGGVAGMEAFRHFIDGEDANGGGKPVVEHDAEVCGRNGAGGLKGCDLGEGVNAGVGASGALGQKLLSGEALDGVGQSALDGGLAGLNLPAVEGRAVIGEREFESAGAHRSHGFQGWLPTISRFQGWRVLRAKSRRRISNQEQCPATGRYILRGMNASNRE